MDRGVLDTIEREIDEEVRARFPCSAVRQAVLLQYGDDPEIEPGDLWVRVLLDADGPEDNWEPALMAFEQANMLEEFWTTLSWNNTGAVNRLLPGSLRRLFERRSFPKSVREKTHTLPLRETVRLLAGAAGASPQHETGIFSMDAVLRELDRKVATRLRKITDCTAVYAYEDGALETFRAAHDLGVNCIYDLPIGYWQVGQRLFAEEKEREPEWSCTLTGALDSAEKLSRKDDELRLANHVVVASTFTKNTLADAPGAAKIEVIPYGAPRSISAEIS